MLHCSQAELQDYYGEYQNPVSEASIQKLPTTTKIQHPYLISVEQISGLAGGQWGEAGQTCPRNKVRGELSNSGA